MPGDPLDLDLPSGRLRAERRGDPGAPLVLCVHGLSANLRAFDVIGPALAEAGRQVVALDLRGRGASDVTPPGTYGFVAHAHDVLDAATRLGAERFAVVGWSMGALIALRMARLAPERLERVVLLDAAGEIEPAAVEAVRAGLARLSAEVPDPATYVDAIRALGVATPWHELWEGHYRYELARGEDGLWRPRTDRAAAEEDLAGSDEPHSLFWADLTMPSLLVRCTVPLGGGLLVPDREARRFPGEVVDVERNHFGVMTADDTVDAVTRSLQP